MWWDAEFPDPVMLNSFQHPSRLQHLYQFSRRLQKVSGPGFSEKATVLEAEGFSDLQKRVDTLAV